MDNHFTIKQDTLDIIELFIQKCFSDNLQENLGTLNNQSEYQILYIIKEIIRLEINPIQNLQYFFNFMPFQNDDTALVIHSFKPKCKIFDYETFDPLDKFINMMNFTSKESEFIKIRTEISNIIRERIEKESNLNYRITQNLDVTLSKRNDLLNHYIALEIHLVNWGILYFYPFSNELNKLIQELRMFKSGIAFNLSSLNLERAALYFLTIDEYCERLAKHLRNNNTIEEKNKIKAFLNRENSFEQSLFFRFQSEYSDHDYAFRDDGFKMTPRDVMANDFLQSEDILFLNDNEKEKALTEFLVLNEEVISQETLAVKKWEELNSNHYDHWNTDMLEWIDNFKEKGNNPFIKTHYKKLNLSDDKKFEELVIDLTKCIKTLSPVSFNIDHLKNDLYLNMEPFFQIQRKNKNDIASNFKELPGILSKFDQANRIIFLTQLGDFLKTDKIALGNNSNPQNLVITNIRGMFGKYFTEGFSNTVLKNYYS
ncbi:hypothetical protein [Nonlabens sp. Asnod3-A02]|uniref:hypothetical protein n=1 Tax=Nonlabens sp. Asnod3-A02 TaxID=3160579 RepID=UPI00386BD674